MWCTKSPENGTVLPIYVGVTKTILLCMLYVHVVGLVKENKFIRKHGASSCKIGTNILEKSASPIFRVCVRALHRP